MQERQVVDCNGDSDTAWLALRANCLLLLLAMGFTIPLQRYLTLDANGGAYCGRLLRSFSTDFPVAVHRSYGEPDRSPPTLCIPARPCR